MPPSIRKRARAERDLVEQYVYLAEEGGIEIAERFLLNAQNAFEELARHPLMGAPVSTRSPKLAALRKWPVHGFDNVLIFYLPQSDGVSIVRVLHGATDWWSLLGLQ